MAGRGVHFAITTEELNKLRSFESDDEKIEYVHEVLEERWEDGFVCETDKAWLAIDVCLNHGDYSYGHPDPVCRAVLSGEDLIEDDVGEYIIVLDALEVRECADHLAGVTSEEIAERFRQLYDAGNEHLRNEPDEVEYVVDWYEPLVEFFGRASEVGRCVIFSVDG